MFTSLDNMGKVTLMMDLITQKQRALGSNLANIDTPGYVRRDVNFGDYLNSMNSPLERNFQRCSARQVLLMKEEMKKLILQMS